MSIRATERRASDFAERMAYLRWLLSRGRVAPLSDRQLAERLGVGTKWLTKWKTRPDAPPGRTEALAIERALAPIGATIAWLYDDTDPPPHPDLWTAWRTPSPSASRGRRRS